MRKKPSFLILASVLCLTLSAGWSIALAADSVPNMTKEELKEKLGDPEVVIVDVRTGKDWKASEFKIQGAVHEDGKNPEEWASKYPKEQNLVLYCA